MCKLLLGVILVTLIERLLCFRAYKTIVEDDLKFPLIYGEGKKVRWMSNNQAFNATW